MGITSLEHRKAPNGNKGREQYSCEATDLSKLVRLYGDLTETTRTGELTD